MPRQRRRSEGRCGGSAWLCSPESRLFGGLIVDREMRSIVALLAEEQAFDTRGGQAGGEQRSLDRIWGLARQEHLFHVVHLRAEEIRERGAAVRHRQVHLSRPRLAR